MQLYHFRCLVLNRRFIQKTLADQSVTKFFGVLAPKFLFRSQLIVIGADIFSRIKACEEEQGSMVHPCDRRDDEHNAET
jgi:hypothetical protein